jgi:hypothetical protein
MVVVSGGAVALDQRARRAVPLLTQVGLGAGEKSIDGFEFD